LGLIIPTYTFFHLIIHAIFKRCIFLQIGFFIQASYGNQDTRFFSATYLRSILRRFFFFCCNFSLCGLFFFSGFLRKDIIISIGYYSGLRFLFQILFFFCIFFTYLYTIRLIIFLVGTTQISIYTFFSQIPIFFSSFPLLIGGLFSGWIIINNNIIQNRIRIFQEKIIPFFILFGVFLFFFFNFNLETKIRKIFFLDSLNQTFLFFLFYPRKSLDFCLDKRIINSIKDFFFLTKNLKKIIIHWPLGGLFFLFYLSFYIFLSFGV